MSKPLLIVVDDERDMAEFIGHAGEKVGFRVEIATSGQEFKRLYEGRAGERHRYGYCFTRHGW